MNAVNLLEAIVSDIPPAAVTYLTQQCSAPLLWKSNLCEDTSLLMAQNRTIPIEAGPLTQLYYKKTDLSAGNEPNEHLNT